MLWRRMKRILELREVRVRFGMDEGEVNGILSNLSRVSNFMFFAELFLSDSAKSFSICVSRDESDFPQANEFKKLLKKCDKIDIYKPLTQVLMRKFREVWASKSFKPSSSRSSKFE
jgi:hypothetical protein